MWIGPFLGQGDDGLLTLECYRLLAESVAKKLSDPGGDKGDDIKSQKEPGHAAKTLSADRGIASCVPIWPECYALAAITRLGPATR